MMQLKAPVKHYANALISNLVAAFVAHLQMQKYKIKVKIKGVWVVTVMYADSNTHARLLAEYEYGLGNVQLIGVMQ